MPFALAPAGVRSGDSLELRIVVVDDGNGLSHAGLVQASGYHNGRCVNTHGIEPIGGCSEGWLRPRLCHVGYPFARLRAKGFVDVDRHNIASDQVAGAVRGKALSLVIGSGTNCIQCLHLAARNLCQNQHLVLAANRIVFLVDDAQPFAFRQHH